MNTLHLKALLLSIETGSISAAARQLNKKQSQVSQWISDLEVDLGVRFFDRTGNKTTLSQDGERLLPNLTHTLSQLEKFVQSAENLAKNEPTLLVIGIENFVPDIIFTKSLALILNMPLLSVVVYRDEKAQLEQALRDGHVDIILTHESTTIHHKDFDYCRLGSYQEILVCSPEHPLVQRLPIHSHDLSEYRELVWGESHAGDNDGFSPYYAIFSDMACLITMLKNNQGYAFLPKESVSAEIANGQLTAIRCEFELSDTIRNVELCWRHGFTFSGVGDQVIEQFKNHHRIIE
ncbi:LysR family transcriptional regulator (plasmid) [Photobacterium sp. GJ3]|uniref:LysR family transcriptional regulator n=1 Tax=Photobacterium sp. GJ3 TaxID=2829502 RepID=UPI001B8B49F1|nr:LysR family transcriptional regulator [Photobacterium sp. GJ3]QUJ69593.1 LysR family transcriptional regulator [Photobacterium sp. GJ3]